MTYIKWGHLQGMQQVIDLRSSGRHLLGAILLSLSLRYYIHHCDVMAWAQYIKETLFSFIYYHDYVI